MVRIRLPPGERCYGAGGEMATSSLHLIDGVPAMPQSNDLSRSLGALDQNSTIIAVVELSRRAGWLAVSFRGIELVPMRSLTPAAGTTTRRQLPQGRARGVFAVPRELRQGHRGIRNRPR
jgi:hypothetical protein